MVVVCFNVEWFLPSTKVKDGEVCSIVMFRCRIGDSFRASEMLRQPQNTRFGG